MTKLSKILHLNPRLRLADQLQAVLLKLEVEPRMEKLGADTSDKRLLLSNKVNKERMGKNPINLLEFKKSIFELDG
jgi:hypothetical protein